jgi:putative heme-binding domain-containing protein
VIQFNFRLISFTLILIILFVSEVAAKEISADTLAKKGEPLFIHYCSHCHGAYGDGEGFNAEYLDRQPANLTDPEFMAKRKDSRIFRVVKKGGPEVRKSNLMPSFGNTLSDLEIWSLVAYVRTLSGGVLKELPKDINDKRPKIKKISKKDWKDFKAWKKAGGLDSDAGFGELLVNNKKSCPACHSIEGEGGALGPDLTRAGLLYSPEWLFQWLNNPQAVKPNTKMPDQGLSNKEIKAIISFLAAMVGEDEEEPLNISKKSDPKNGKKLFFDLKGKGKCAKCHSINQEGGNIGPDLSFVGSSRNDSFIIESLLDPSKVLTSGYSTISVITKDGKFYNGIQKNETLQAFDVVDKFGKVNLINRSRVNKFKFSENSLMPDNFKTELSEQEIADIVSYLKSLKFSNEK